MSFLSISLLFFPLVSFAHSLPLQSQIVLTNLDAAKASGAVILAKDSHMNTAVAFASPSQLEKITAVNHLQGKCAGFEALDEASSLNPAQVINGLQLTQFKFARQGILQRTPLVFSQDFQKISELADASELKKTVQWISSYPTRFNKDPQPNTHVFDLVKKLESELKDAPWTYEIKIIPHSSTAQNSVVLKILGNKRPQESVVIGGHFDSINQSYMPGSKAPGADDNASGSANVIEAVKALKNWRSFDRSIEFYWYAGEESGLLGSAEIAKSAKSTNKDVIAVLQLDMTLFPGSGVHTIGLVNDFTSPWLRGVLSDINSLYVKAKFVDDKCGYACSDHASWFRQGYHAVTPFEATTQTMNNSIHTAKDIINASSNFEHSNNFTKFAILFALVIGNSEIRP